LHLRYAAAAADLGSFRRAAEALQVRQSTLSRCIRRLEESIGATVFERSSGGVRVTTAGRDFLRAARSIIEQVEALVTTVGNTRRGETGRLAVGFYTSLAAGNLRMALMDYAQRFPEVEIDLIEKSRTRLTAALQHGVIDVAIITGEDQLGESLSMPLWSERILIALPNDHALAAKDVIYWTDLKNEVVVLSRRDPGPELYNILTARLVSPGERPRVSQLDVTQTSTKSAVSARFGLSLVLESSVGVKLDGVVYREIRDGSGPAMQIYTARWRAENDNPTLLSLLSLLRERYSLPSVG
jgi:DNA-binding transcriptional LysR family regulator